MSKPDLKKDEILLNNSRQDVLLNMARHDRKKIVKKFEKCVRSATIQEFIDIFEILIRSGNNDRNTIFGKNVEEVNNDWINTLKRIVRNYKKKLETKKK